MRRREPCGCSRSGNTRRQATAASGSPLPRPWSPLAPGAVAPLAGMNTGGTQAARPGGSRLGRESAEVRLSLGAIRWVWGAVKNSAEGGPCGEGPGPTQGVAAPGASHPPWEPSGLVTDMTHSAGVSHPGEVRAGVAGEACGESQSLARRGSSWSLGTDFPAVPPFSALEATSTPPSPGQVRSVPQALGLRP